MAVFSVISIHDKPEVIVNLTYQVRPLFRGADDEFDIFQIFGDVIYH